MAKNNIPIRPKDFVSNLTQNEQTCLTWYVLSGCNKKDAYLTFVRPDMFDSRAKAAVDDYIKQFYARKEVLDYMDAYQSTLNSFLHPKPTKRASSGSMEERKANAKTKLVEFAMNLADNIESADDPETVLKLADKVGLLDQEEQVEETPRRYLPVACVRECAYRMFCEQNTEDMCKYCKYKEYGEYAGLHYDKEHMLNYRGMEIAGEK